MKVWKRSNERSDELMFNETQETYRKNHNYLIYGFTGTQRGATPDQMACLSALFAELDVKVLHHGGCHGADTQAHHLALAHNIVTRVHPGPAGTECMSDVIYSVEPNLKRNMIIATLIDGLFATPAQNKEVLRSGTWATIRYARKNKKQIWIIQLDGTFQEERP